MSRAASTGVKLGDAAVDDLGRAVLLLARELWVVKDRQRVLEAVLAERGIDVARTIADHQPGPELAAALAEERRRFVGDLIATLCPEAER